MLCLDEPLSFFHQSAILQQTERHLFDLVIGQLIQLAMIEEAFWVCVMASAVFDESAITPIAAKAAVIE
jgi:hypothetical protein